MSDDSNEDAGATKGMSLTPALTALFKPTTEYLGTELRDGVKATIEGLKKRKRGENLDAHVAAVQERLRDDPPEGSDAEATLAQLSFFETWVDSVQDIDPAETELSQMWELLLAEAARGTSHMPEVIDALKSLTPFEAKFLLAHWSSPRSRYKPMAGPVEQELYFVGKLESKGIIELDNYTTRILLAPMLFAGIAGVTLGLYIQRYASKTLARDREALQASEAMRAQGLDPPIEVISPPGMGLDAGDIVIYLSIGLFFVAVVLMRLFRRNSMTFKHWRLTWLGQALLASVRPPKPKK